MPLLQRISVDYHLHPIVDHFTIALLVFGVAMELIAGAAAVIARSASPLTAFAIRLRTSSLPLMIGGAASAVLSRLTGDIEADRLWETMPPGAQRIVAAPDGVRSYLSHAALGEYLMYSFLALAGWRLLMEFSPRLIRWRAAFLIAAALAACGLLYQGKTGGELVYRHGVGMETPIKKPQA